MRRTLALVKSRELSRFLNPMVFAAGCISAAFLHLLTQWEWGRGSGPDFYHGYAHILVPPLLCGGAVASVLLALWRAISTRTITKAVAGQPFLPTSASIALCACGTFTLAESIEQFISLGHVGDVLPISCGFVLQLLLVSAVVTFALNALMRLCFQAVSAVVALVSFCSSCMTACTGPVLRRPDAAPQAIVAIIADSVGRRGPPRLQLH